MPDISSTAAVPPSPRLLTQMRSGFALLLTTMLLLNACGGDDHAGFEQITPKPTPDPIDYPTQAAAQIPLGMQAQISDSLQLNVKGPGAYRLVPLRRQRPGYHYLADGNESDGYEIVLILPSAASAGVYNLTSTGPYEIGRDFSAKVTSRDYGSFSHRVEGLLTLNQIQSHGQDRALASGNFTFAAENEAGQRIVVDGRFNFQP